MKEAWLNTKLDNGKIRCDACAHFCVLGDGETGKCGVRKALGGELSLEVYGLLNAINIDPIEKNPSITSSQILRYYLSARSGATSPVRSAKTTS